MELPGLVNVDGVLTADGVSPFPWLFDRAVVATYVLSAPGPVWEAKDNGAYTILLADNEVGLKGGGYLPHQLLGTFGVRVGEPGVAGVEDWEVEIVDGNTGCLANLNLVFDQPAEVDWGQVMREGNKLFVHVSAKAADSGLLRATNSYALGDLPPGGYFLEIRVNDRLLGIKRFAKRDEPLRVPAETEVAILDGPAGPLSAHVHVHFLKPGWAVVDAGQIQRKGNRFFVDAKAEPNADEEVGVWEGTYEIAAPEPGVYTFTFCLNGQVCDSARI